MEHGLLLLTLDHEWYGRNKGRLLPEFFPGGLLPLFETIKEAHDTYERTLTLDEVVALYRANNPSLTTAARRDFEELLFDLKREQPLGPDVAEDVLTKLWLQEVGRQIAEDALVMADAVTLSIELEAGDGSQAIDKAFEFADAMRPDVEPSMITLDRSVVLEITSYLES